MNAIRYLLLAGLAFMALAAVAIFVYRILSTSSARLEVGGVVPYLSILGVLAFLIGSGLVVYDNHRYQGLGLGLAGLGWLAIVGSFFIARWKSQRMP